VSSLCQAELYLAISEGKISVHNRMIQLRKVCNHPFLFHPATKHSDGTLHYPLDEDLSTYLCFTWPDLNAISVDQCPCIVVFRLLIGTCNVHVGCATVRVCGKFILLDQILRKLRETGHRVLIFNQMTKTMDVLADFFKLRGYPFLRLDGNY